MKRRAAAVCLSLALSVAALSGQCLAAGSRRK